MTRKQAFTVALVGMLATIATAPAFAGQVIEEAGTITCVTDKVDEKEIAKGHKLVDVKSRCVLIPDKVTDPKMHEVCSGKYEYLPDGSWKGTGTCIDTYQGGDTAECTWEEGSHLKEYPYTRINGTGKYKGIKGGGTYFYEGLTDTLFGGRYKGRSEIP